MGVLDWRRRRRANAAIDRIADVVGTGDTLLADAIAYGREGEPTTIPGVAQCCDEHFHFRADAEPAFGAGGWFVPRSRIGCVQEGAAPGELVVTFDPPARFRAVVVTPVLHLDKWRALDPD
ncbi:hypothetical protein [Streptomyces sp. NPDC026659]|uniref:hypothetical protein n=1 Tax=Streptomyces sp. NPDC026659 TaxID=3155123 RepID=UPI0033D5DA11